VAVLLHSAQWCCMLSSARSCMPCVFAELLAVEQFEQAVAQHLTLALCSIQFQKESVCLVCMSALNIFCEVCKFNSKLGKKKALVGRRQFYELLRCALNTAGNLKH